MKTIQALTVMLSLLTMTSSRADFVVVIGNLDNSPISFDAGTGSLVSVPVFAYNDNTAASFSLQAFDLAFDFGEDGFGIPGSPYFTDINANFDNSVFLATSIGTYSLPNDSGTPTDLYAGDFVNVGDALPMPTSQATAARLFDIEFRIDATTPGAFYDLTLDLPDFQVISGPSAAGVTISPATGSNLNGFTVNAVAVPEPGSMLALAGLFTVGGVRRWRKKKRSSLSPTSA
ncbi:PEP-CTERM sorting domain-containing protein [Neorhodopirellula lusitana]|nr:PEP-CTERM sorting domain-containing protein [Neorhodopirellula lusitana]